MQMFDVDVARNPSHAARLATEFFLRQIVTIARGFEGDFLLGLVFIGISAANNRRITRSPDLIRLYPALTDVPAEEHCAPVSVAALARSLGMPFETTRRYVIRLIDSALCARTDDGLLLTRAALASDKVVDMIATSNADLRIFLAALRRDGYISSSNGPSAQSLDAIVTRNPRQTVRLTIEYFLRGVKANADYFGGDFLIALILLGILSANNRRIIRAPEVAAAYPAITDVPAAGYRAPISVTALARSLGLSYETTRRKVHKLIDKRMCARTDDGLVLTDEALSGERFMELIRVGNANLRKLITALQRDGLIE